MRPWTWKEILLFLAVLAAAFLYLVVFRQMEGTFPLCFVVGLVFGAVFAYIMKGRGRRIGRAVGLMFLGEGLLYAASNLFLVELTRVIRRITGHYNPEATAFSVLFYILCCVAVQAGMGIGREAWNILHKTKE